MSQLITVLIPAGQALTITANATSAGSYWLIGNPGDAPGAVTNLAAGASAVVGPFQAPKNYELQSDNGVMSAVLAIVGNYNAATDQANEAATYQPILSGEVLTAVTVAAGDKVLVQDLSDASKLKTVTAQSIADLTIGGTAAATLQDHIDLKADIDGPQFTSGVTLLSGANLALDNGGALVLGAPTGSSKGDLVVIGVDNAGAYDVVIQNASHGQSSTYTIPDVGASTDAFVMKAANDTALALLAPLASPIFTTTPLRTTVNNGVAAAGCTAVEYGDGFGQNTVITINQALPAIAGGAALGLGIPIYTFPAGSIMMLSNSQNVALTQSEGHINADTPSIALGTTVASGSVSDLTGTPGFFNFTDTPQTAADCNGTVAYNVCVVGNKIFRTDSHVLYVNYAANWAASGDTAAVVSGTVHINWNFLGA